MDYVGIRRSSLRSVDIIGSCGEVNLVIECKRDEGTTRIGGAVARSFAHL